MDDYRKNLIELVRDRPLLWDPRHSDYKNKDQRKQTWEEIEKRLMPPIGANTNAKDTWDHLTRGFSNAIRRREKRLGNGLDSEMQWRFEQDMVFLLPVKQLRSTSGNVTQMELKMESSPFDETLPEGDTSEDHEETAIEEESQPDRRASQKRKKTDEDDDEDTRTMLNIITEQQVKKSVESPRLNFFRSIMNIVDSFDDEQFMNFQIDVIRAAQRQKRCRTFTFNEPARPVSQSSP